MKFLDSDFVHWHNHTEYSTFDGLAPLDDLVKTSRMRGHPALAVTDHGNMGSLIKLLKLCTDDKDKNGNPLPYAPCKPILGFEGYVARKLEWGKKDEAEKNGGYQSDGRAGNRHLTFYAKNFEGYQNICRLSERSWVDGMYYKDARTDLFEMAKHSKGVMVGSACLSSFVNANLLNDRYDMAVRAVGMLQDIYGKDSVFVEAMYHGYSKQRAILPDIFRVAKATGAPVLATNDCHCIRKDQMNSQAVLMCIATQNCVTNPKHMRHPYDELYFKSAEEMGKMFGHVPQTLSNTVAMAERIDSQDIINNLFGGMRLPHFKLPPEFNDPFKYLVHLAKEGMVRLGWDKSKRHLEALKKELKDVQVAKDSNNYDFSTYFLIVWDYCNFARKQGIVVGCGRGSGYASVLLHCLGIAYGPDPLDYDLYWERFLGFDDKRFIRAADFGYTQPTARKLATTLLDEADDEEDDLDEERDVEEDFGGVDRY